MSSHLCISPSTLTYSFTVVLLNGMFECLLYPRLHAANRFFSISIFFCKRCLVFLVYQVLFFLLENTLVTFINLSIQRLNKHIEFLAPARL